MQCNDLIQYSTKTSYKMFKFINVAFLWTLIWCQDHMAKKLGQRHAYHCVTSSCLLILVSIWELNTLTAEVLKVKFCNMSESPLTYFTLHNAPHTGRDCRKASLVSTFFFSHTVVTHAECSLALLCWNRQGVPEKNTMWMATYVAPKPVFTFQHKCCLCKCASYPRHRQ